jgi:hypothetical protein
MIVFLYDIFTAFVSVCSIHNIAVKWRGFCLPIAIGTGAIAV